MAKETVSNLYGKPKFGLIVAGFLAAIVLILIAGVVFMRYRPAPKEHHRTGMTLLLTASRTGTLPQMQKCPPVQAGISVTG